MNQKSDAFDKLAITARQQIAKEIEKHESGSEGEYTLSLLNNIKNEVDAMVKKKDNSQYSPTYPRFLMDWPEHGDFGEKLLKLARVYEQTFKKSMQHISTPRPPTTENNTNSNGMKM